MVIEWGIALIVVITIIMALFRVFFKTAFKIISIIWFVMFLGTVAFGIIIYMDAKEFSESFPENDNLFALDSGGNIVAGRVVHGSEETEILGDVAKIDELYQEGGIEAMSAEGNYFKLMICNESCFDGIQDVEIAGFNISKDIAIDIINAEDSISKYADLLIEKQGLRADLKDEIISQLDSKQGIQTETKMRGIMFETLFTAMTVQEGPFFIIKEYKKGNMKIYEETLIFKLIKIFPAKVFEDVFEKAENNMEDIENGSV